MAKIDTSRHDAASKLAALAAEHMRWQGRGLIPSKGCKFREMSLSDATVLVEYEYFPGEAVTRDHPGADPELNVVGVLINGALFDPEGILDASVIERWEEELRIHEAETAGDDADRAAEARAEWLREAA